MLGFLSSVFAEMGEKLDLLQGNIKKIYLKYLFASFGGAILPAVYGIVDMIAVGQYHGPDGAAAMAVIAPVWNIIFSVGMLTGIGASILFSVAKSSGDRKKANDYFTAGFWLAVVLSLLIWVGIVCFETELLTALGADSTLMPLAKQYMIPVKYGVPVQLFMQFLASFLRNDNHPELATKAVLAGGAFNILGDYFFVFILDMGIFGAGLATILGAVLSLVIGLSHFKSDKNTLKLVRPTGLLHQWKQIFSLGFPSSFADLALGILTMLFNIQIMKYMGSDALAVFAIIVNVATFAQCTAYGVGQAAQPIISTNFGAGKPQRIGEVFRLNVITVAILSGLWVFVTMAFPNGFVHLFMSPTPAVLEIAPSILRLYSISYLLLPFNIYATYYFQSTMRPTIAFVVSVMRGLVVSGILIMMLPPLLGANTIWLSMPITELLTFLVILFAIKKSPRI